MPRGEANVATVEIEAQRDVPHNGSPARRHAPPLNGDEANAPGAPQPPRRSARRTPCAQAPVRAADPRSGAGSDQQQPAEQQGRSRQDAQEEVDEERVRSPRNICGQEQQGDPSDQREGGARSAGGRHGGGRTADQGGRAAGRGERARGGGLENMYQQVLGSCEMGVGAGPSGTTFEHLCDAALINSSVGKHLHARINTILTGNLPPAVAELLTTSRLIALTKPDGGTRPIAIGESITRLAAKTALTLTPGAAREFFLPHQFGMAVPGGAKAIIHITHTYLMANPGALALQADLANAFNSVNWAAIAASLRGSSLASLLPPVKLSYGLPSALCLDAGFSHPPLRSETGVRQGDPLGPLLFAAAVHPALTSTALAFPSVVCLAYADNVTFLGEAAAAFENFTGNLGGIGLRHNPAKCAAWSQMGQQGATLPHGVPFTDDGVKVLGSFIGGNDATAAFLRESLDTMGGPLPLIARMEPQLASLLLTRCISRRVSYMARTTPLSPLLVEEWSDWGKRLFETLLTTCGIGHPQGEAEITRTWAQASLPINACSRSWGTGQGTGSTRSPSTSHCALPQTTLSTRCSSGWGCPPRHLVPVTAAMRRQSLTGGCPTTFCAATRGRAGPTRTTNCTTSACGWPVTRKKDFMTHSETTAFSPVTRKKADIAIRDKSSGAVWIGDVTITDPISTRDPNAVKGRGWAAREAAEKKISDHEGSTASWVGFFPLAVDTYGCRCAEVPQHLKLLADTAARRLFNAPPSSYQATKLLHQFRQRWSVALQQAQSVSFMTKSFMKKCGSSGEPTSVAPGRRHVPWGLLCHPGTSIGAALEEELECVGRGGFSS
ncbi:unnamed protein product [Closterium sp. NIES-53]